MLTKSPKRQDSWLSKSNLRREATAPPTNDFRGSRDGDFPMISVTQKFLLEEESEGSEGSSRSRSLRSSLEKEDDSIAEEGGDDKGDGQEKKGERANMRMSEARGI